MSLSLGYNVLVTPPGWQHHLQLRRRRWSSRGGYGSLWEGAGWRTKIQLERFRSEGRRSLFFRKLSMLSGSQNVQFTVSLIPSSIVTVTASAFADSASIWQGCLDLTIYVGSASLSSVDTIQSFSRQSPTLLDESDITASSKDWTATSTLTSLLPTTLSKLKDVT